MMAQNDSCGDMKTSFYLERKIAYTFNAYPSLVLAYFRTNHFE